MYPRWQAALKGDEWPAILCNANSVELQAKNAHHWMGLVLSPLLVWVRALSVVILL